MVRVRRVPVGRGKSGTPIFNKRHRDALPIKGDFAGMREIECGNLSRALEKWPSG